MSDTPHEPTQEPKNLVLVKLDQVLDRIDHLEGKLYVELFQMKTRLSAVEQQVASLHAAVVQQWATMDQHDETQNKLEQRLHKLERQG
jgi:uncharacterized coiled-coil protein SlyX